jgi:phosphonatase-like hydrolase
MRIRLAVLDVGGTVIRDTADVPAVFKAALARHGLSATDAQLHAWRGAAKREVIGRLAAGSAADPERVYASFQELLIASFAERGVRPIDGVETAIAALRAGGVRVALTTGFDRKVADGLLARLGWSGKVDAVVCADEVAQGRPAPDMILRAMDLTGVRDAREVLCAGDTDNDLQAGARAAVGANIGVLSGAHDRLRLASAPHDAILESAAGLPAWLAQRDGGGREAQEAEKKEARR